MSLLLNEDFSIYNLRLAYLQNIHDGVGERLINLNSSVLNNPAFRAAGWTPDTITSKRCYSPPIPTTGASEYFRLPGRRRGVTLEDDGGNENTIAGGGMVTGQQGLEDTVPASLHERRRRRTRKEQLEEDDSSDLSDDSEEDEKSAAHDIKFSKMPGRGRSKSSPTDALNAEQNKDDGPSLFITSPSKPPVDSGISVTRQRLRSGSGGLGGVELVKQRARRDTTTSSEMSSENELDPSLFNRKMSGRPDAKRSVLLSERIQEEEPALHDDAEVGDSDLEDEDVGEASDLSDEFEMDGELNDGTPTLLGTGIGGISGDTNSPVKPPPVMPPAIGPRDHSPRKQSAQNFSLPKIERLPPERLITAVAGTSLITLGLKGDHGEIAASKPFQRFADLSGKGEANPLWIKIYAPFSSTPTDAIQVQIRRTKDGNAVTVAELIGLALWRYNEEGYQPLLTADDTDANINRWDLRIVEDEEIDYDFPALIRTRPVTDFTSNNNRPPQRRARDKPWDEFGLVRSSEEQTKDNERSTPQGGQTSFPAALPGATTPNAKAPRPVLPQRSEAEASMISTQSTRTVVKEPPRNPITGTTFTSAAPRKDGVDALDAPQKGIAQSTPRTGVPKTVVLHFTNPQTFAVNNVHQATMSDTYIAEIFEQGCKKLGLDKALYVLKVHGTQTVAPLDRTVEALGDRLHLDLVRRRFVGATAGEGVFGLGLSGSPASSSPNAPIDLQLDRTPPGVTTGRMGRKKPTFAGTFGQQPKIDQINASTLDLVGLGLGIDDIGGKKYNVLRKQPLSFAPSHPRTLIITPEYMQILPAPSLEDTMARPQGKVTNVPMSSIIGVKVSRKHPKMVRVLVFREKETKRYDFECADPKEAVNVVTDIRKGVEAVRKVEEG